MANRWGWHSRAIATAADNGLLDDLAIRYPTPFLRFFDSYSNAAQVEMTWAYGIARSESLFMTDVRSSAGALGLMQLMPATGKDTAIQARVPYRGTISLLDPEINITLGTHYLGEMRTRFSNNPVLATAAYNAGPHRVDRWLPDAQPMDADIWIDSIPFRETRRYLRRVLASQAIFYWRMHDDTQRVKTQMPPVLPAQDDNG
jgi:soluble lytic murein transglycosylase